MTDEIRQAKLLLLKEQERNLRSRLSAVLAKQEKLEEMVCEAEE